MRILNADQASSSGFLGRPDCRITELGHVDSPASGQANIMSCPKPFRPRASRMVDYVDRNWPRQEGVLTSDLLDLFPGKITRWCLMRSL